MAYSLRVIPRLDIKGPNLVKGIHLEGLRILGKPERFARYYYEAGADELLYIDVVASLYGRNSIVDVVKRTSKEIFIPLTVGGGLRTTEDIRTVLNAGADKVALNTAAIENPDLIKEASKKFGSSTIVISIHAIKQPDGSYGAYVNNGRDATGLNAISWAIQAAELGAGELLVTSVDREGTGKGYDIELYRTITESVSIPVIACGGAGSLADISLVATKGKVDAICVASMLHYYVIQKCNFDDDFSSEGNTHFLRQGNSFSKFQVITIQDIKEDLYQHNIFCRYYANNS